MAFSLYLKHLNTEAYLEVDSQHGSVEQSPAIPQAEIEETIAVSPLQPMPEVESPAQGYSPVGIILATCVLVTAIGRALKPKT